MDFNDRLDKLVQQMSELHAWMMPASEKLDYITTTQELTPEDRVKEIFDLQAQVSQNLIILAEALRDHNACSELYAYLILG